MISPSGDCFKFEFLGSCRVQFRTFLPGLIGIFVTAAELCTFLCINLTFCIDLLEKYLFSLILCLKPGKRAVWFAAQTIAKEVDVQNVRLQLLCITNLDEVYVLLYWLKLEAARSKCSVGLPSIDRYLSALDSGYCIPSSFLPKHGNRVGSNRKSLEATRPYLWNRLWNWGNSFAKRKQSDDNAFQTRS